MAGGRWRKEEGNGFVEGFEETDSRPVARKNLQAATTIKFRPLIRFFKGLLENYRARLHPLGACFPRDALLGSGWRTPKLQRSTLTDKEKMRGSQTGDGWCAFGEHCPTAALPYWTIGWMVFFFFCFVCRRVETTTRHYTPVPATDIFIKF